MKRVLSNASGRLKKPSGSVARRASTPMQPVDQSMSVSHAGHMRIMIAQIVELSPDRPGMEMR